MYKVHEVRWHDGEKEICIDCLYHEADDRHLAEWLPDMATLRVGRDNRYAATTQERHEWWSHAYDLANQ